MHTVPPRPPVRKSAVCDPAVTNHLMLWDALAEVMANSPQEKVRNLLAIGARFGRLRRAETGRAMVIIAIGAILSQPPM